jgi:hypothetical protein
MHPPVSQEVSEKQELFVYEIVLIKDYIIFREQN